MPQASAGRTVILGLGDALQGDDGVGAAVIDRLRAEWRFSPVVDLFDARTWSDSLLDTMAGADAALIVTSLDAGLEPGQMVQLCAADLARVFEVKSSPARLDLALALAIAAWRGQLPERTSMIGVQPAESHAHVGLSPRVQARFDVLLFRITRQLQAWGTSCWRAGNGVGSHA